MDTPGSPVNSLTASANLILRDTVESEIRRLFGVLSASLKAMPNRYGDTNTVERRMVLKHVEEIRGDVMRAVDVAIINHQIKLRAAALVAGAHQKEKEQEDLARVDERDSSVVSSPPQRPTGDK